MEAVMLRSVKIGARLFGLAAGLMVAMLALALVGMRGTSSVNERLTSAIATSRMETQQINRARSAQVHFKTQVQEWKNVLLRGKNPELYTKHLTGFQNEEAAVKA